MTDPKECRRGWHARLWVVTCPVQYCLIAGPLGALCCKAHSENWQCCVQPCTVRPGLPLIDSLVAKQGTVVGMSHDQLQWRVQLHAGFPRDANFLQRQVMWIAYDATTRRLLPNTTDIYPTSIQPLDDAGLVLLTQLNVVPHVNVGHLVAARGPGPHGLYLAECRSGLPLAIRSVRSCVGSVGW